ncbi:MAG: hypothetical protein QXE59_06165 [Saccharolobus sp.]
MKEDKITKRATEIKGNLLVNFSIPYDTLALLYLAFVIFQSTLALYAQRYYDWGAIQVVIALAIIGLESAILQIVVVPRLINKISAKNTIILGGISMGIGFVMIYFKVYYMGFHSYYRLRFVNVSNFWISANLNTCRRIEERRGFRTIAVIKFIDGRNWTHSRWFSFSIIRC